MGISTIRIANSRVSNENFQAERLSNSGSRVLVDRRVLRRCRRRLGGWLVSGVHFFIFINLLCVNLILIAVGCILGKVSVSCSGVGGFINRCIVVDKVVLLVTPLP